MKVIWEVGGSRKRDDRERSEMREKERRLASRSCSTQIYFHKGDQINIEALARPGSYPTTGTAGEVEAVGGRVRVAVITLKPSITLSPYGMPDHRAPAKHLRARK